MSTFSPETLAKLDKTLEPVTRAKWLSYLSHQGYTFYAEAGEPPEGETSLISDAGIAWLSAQRAANDDPLEIAPERPAEFRPEPQRTDPKAAARVRALRSAFSRKLTQTFRDYQPFDAREAADKTGKSFEQMRSYLANEVMLSGGRIRAHPEPGFYMLVDVFSENI